MIFWWKWMALGWYCWTHKVWFASEVNQLRYKKQAQIIPFKKRVANDR